jgi:CheY-like chemotaxis protein
MMLAGNRCFSLLLVDDSEDDRLFLRFGLRNHSCFKIVGEVENGMEAIDYLAGKGKYADREQFPLPDLMILDLKMPLLDGFGLLSWLQKQSFPNLKIMVLSGTCLKQDAFLAMQLGAHAFQIKPASREDQDAICATMKTLLEVALENNYQTK